MTGLDPIKNKILEIAVVVTDGSLTQVEEGPNLVIHLNESDLVTMSEWCVEHHGKSGLVQASRDSNVSLQEAERLVLDFVERKVGEKGVAPLGGNSVHADRMFLYFHMRNLYDYLHYRIIDVSTIKELYARWYQTDYSEGQSKNVKNLDKAVKHRALDDIRESIQELQFYRQNIFRTY